MSGGSQSAAVRLSPAAVQQGRQHQARPAEVEPRCDVHCGQLKSAACEGDRQPSFALSLKCSVVEE